MDKYKKIEEIGRGAFGIVWKALNKETNEIVAIKKLFENYYTMEECMNLKEVKSLIKMNNNHPNIVSLKEIVRENDVLFIVFEYMENDLYKVIENRIMDRQPFKEIEIRDLCYQVFKGLAYMHSNGYFHRDVKPANLLVTSARPVCQLQYPVAYFIKIGDLGQAREINGERPYTHDVSTLWYRAPEVFLDIPVYSCAVDMWAMGAIMAELFTLEPLFKGDTEVDVMYKICNVLGTPTKNSWDEGLDLAKNIGYEFPNVCGSQFSYHLLKSASADAIDLIRSLLSWDPKMRPTAMEALQHRFFDGCHDVVPRTVKGTRSCSSGLEVASSREEMIKLFSKRMDLSEDEVICSKKMHMISKM